METDELPANVDKPLPAIDKALVAERFAKAADSYDSCAEVQRHAAARLVELVRRHAGEVFPAILEIGCGTGGLSRLLARAFAPDRLVLNDLCPGMRGYVADLLATGAEFLPGDAEDAVSVSAAGMDLVASGSVVQWLADPAGLFRRWRGELASGSWLAFTAYGPGNLHEIASLTGTGLAYRSLGEWEELLRPGWRIAHAGEETRRLVFPSPAEVLRHLKRTGVTGVARRRWTRGALGEFKREYARLYSTGDGVQLTYRPQYVVAEAV